MEGLRRSRVPSVTVCLLALSLAACTPEAPGSGSSPSETASTWTARDLAPSTDTSTAETLSGLTPPAEAPIVVGSGTASTRHTLEMCAAAKEVGADGVLIEIGRAHV